MALKRAVWIQVEEHRGRLSAGGVLGHSLRTLGDGVLRQLAREQNTHGRLDLAGRDRRPAIWLSRSLVVAMSLNLSR